MRDLQPDPKKAFYSAIGSLTSPPQALSLASGLRHRHPGDTGSSASPSELSSLYTLLDLKKCKDEPPTGATEYGTI